MSELRIQAHLRAGNKPESLTEKYVKHRRHREHANLVLFKYDIFANFGDPLVRECRGIVLDEHNDWHVVSRAFDKFFNYGEGHAANIDWGTARVQEKLDGSLCVLYHYAGKWHVATSGTPDAMGEVRGSGVQESMQVSTKRTFADFFWETFKKEGGRLPHGDSFENLSFAFELMGPANRVVVVHDRDWLRLLAVRDRRDGRELPIEPYAAALGIQPVRSFPLQTIEEIHNSFEHISPVSQEGYIVVDSNFDRIKIKHPGYVALHHAKDGMSPKAFAEIARSGEVPEVIAAFPEFGPMLEETRAKYTAWVERVTNDFDRLKHIEVQKDFALEATKTTYSAALFQLRKGKDLRELARSVSIDTLMQWIGM
jgi:hypothetical protein